MSRNTWWPPRRCRADLHWFKWEAYLTFLSGFGLLIVQYYWNAVALPRRPGGARHLRPEAVLISILSLAARLVRL